MPATSNKLESTELDVQEKSRFSQTTQTEQAASDALFSVFYPVKYIR